MGRKRHRFAVHKKLICEISDFFNKAFRGHFKEGGERAIELQEESEGAISLFFGWIYRSELPEGYNQSYLNGLFELNIFAEKICLPRLVDYTNPKTFEKVYKNANENSKLRGFCIELMALDTSTEDCRSLTS